MVGYSAMREVTLWVQTTASARVKIIYWEKGKEAVKHETNSVKTMKKWAFTAHLIADQVEPGKKYEYRLVVNGNIVERPYPLEFKTQKLWQWREDPPDVKFAAGSCFYVNEDQYDRPGTPYGGKFEILDAIYNQRPEFMLWIGDALYLREVDWDSWTGIVKRYTHDRSYPALQKILGSIHNYAIWDDHDYGPNNSDRSFWNKKATLKAFKLFWANPSYGVEDLNGITTYFEWSDAAFFLTDGRTFRSPEDRKNIEKVMLGREQIDWLIDALSGCNLPFKFIVVGSQVLNPNLGGEKYSNYPEEKAYLLDQIKKEGITGVIFLSGDIHRTELSKMPRPGTYPLYDFTISPITSGVSKIYPNDYLIDSTMVADRNFATFEITGPRKNRDLKVTDINSEGKVEWVYTINENELK
jgi:alkaline phosphatase D